MSTVKRITLTAHQEKDLEAIFNLALGDYEDDYREGAFQREVDLPIHPEDTIDRIEVLEFADDFDRFLKLYHKIFGKDWVGEWQAYTEQGKPIPLRRSGEEK